MDFALDAMNMDEGGSSSACGRCARLTKTVATLEERVLASEHMITRQHEQIQAQTRQLSEQPSLRAQRELGTLFAQASARERAIATKHQSLLDALHRGGRCLGCGVAAATHGFACGHECVCAACARAMLAQNAAVVTCPLCAGQCGVITTARAPPPPPDVRPAFTDDPRHRDPCAACGFVPGVYA